MFPFLSDLDEFFCETFANYDKLCGLDGYKPPVMQATKTDEFGRTVSYTLPMNEMALSKQEKKETLLVALKEKICDVEFSFPVCHLGFFAQIGQAFSKKSFRRAWRKFCEGKRLKQEDVLAQINVSKSTYLEIIKGRALPCKSLVYSFALAFGASVEETLQLLSACDYGFDFTKEREVVVYYLLHQRVYNREMMNAALKEYKVRNLYLREENA